MTEKLGNGKRSRKSYEMYVHVLNSAYFRNYVRCMDVSSVRIFVSFFLLLRGWYRKGGMEGGKDGRKDGGREEGTNGRKEEGKEEGRKERKNGGRKGRRRLTHRRRTQGKGETKEAK